MSQRLLDSLNWSLVRRCQLVSTDPTSSSIRRISEGESRYTSGGAFGWNLQFTAEAQVAAAAQAHLPAPGARRVMLVTAAAVVEVVTQGCSLAGQIAIPLF